MADEFVKFVHKIQDIASLSSLAFDEESKSEVQLDWIWKNNEVAQPQPIPLVVKIPPAVAKLQTDSVLLDAAKNFNFIKNECFGGRNFEISTLFRGSVDGFSAFGFH
jgi:hypothetical protein